MITIKNKASLRKMEQAGLLLSNIFQAIASYIRPGISTLEIDSYIEKLLDENELKSKTKGYMGYKHVSCISVNDEVVHGVPSSKTILNDGDVVKVDICASWQEYCADMARVFFIGNVHPDVQKMVTVAQKALEAGISQAKPGNRLSDISAAIQQEIDQHGYGIIKDFAGHGIGKQMHEEPEILNYGQKGKGPILREGMTFAIEPMITMGSANVYIAEDEWTVKTEDKSLAIHVEDTIAITSDGPKILTRNKSMQHKSL